jgi:hypothetical protein
MKKYKWRKNTGKQGDFVSIERDGITVALCYVPYMPGTTKKPIGYKEVIDAITQAIDGMNSPSPTENLKLQTENCPP